MIRILFDDFANGAKHPISIGTPEVTQLVANLSAIYSPELTVGFTAACCSDHQVRDIIRLLALLACSLVGVLQSFHEQGFPATQVFERAGPIVDPMYHNSGEFIGPLLDLRNSVLCRRFERPRRLRL